VSEIVDMSGSGESVEEGIGEVVGIEAVNVSTGDTIVKGICLIDPEPSWRYSKVHVSCIS
jgi:hypothetical protein